MYDKDFLGWVSPGPQPLPKYLSLVNPLQPIVWVLIIVTLVLVAVAANIVARAEGTFTGKGYPQVPFDVTLCAVSCTASLGF